MYKRAHAHLQRAHELLHPSHRELYTVGFGGADDVILKTTLGEKVTCEVMRSFMQKNNVQVIEAKVKEIENSSNGEVRGTYAPLKHGMIIKFPLMPKATTTVIVTHKSSIIRRATRECSNIHTKMDVLLRLKLKVKGTGEAFDVPQLNQLSPM